MQEYWFSLTRILIHLVQCEVKYRAIDEEGINDKKDTGNLMKIVTKKDVKFD